MWGGPRARSTNTCNRWSLRRCDASRPSRRRAPPPSPRSRYDDPARRQSASPAPRAARQGPRGVRGRPGRPAARRERSRERVRRGAARARGAQGGGAHPAQRVLVRAARVRHAEMKWLGMTDPSHFISADADAIVERVPALEPFRAALTGRAMLVRRTTPVPFECIVRGYITGSAWAEYQQSGTLAGESLPAGLVESARLDPPIFSPATKAERGHDENVTFTHVVKAVGRALAEQLKQASLALYEAGRGYARPRGIIIADTKFEFGSGADGRLLVIDEILTPDSSRFWPADRYEPGGAQPSFDKQPLRDYLAGLKRQGKWDGNAPPPPLPAEVVQATSERYLEAYRLITGRDLEVDR